MIKKPGLYLEMDAEEYFTDPCVQPSLTQSGIPALLDRSPWHFAFRHPRLNPYGHADEGDKARWLGAAVHRLALGRGREISVIRYPNYQIGSAREARDEAIRNKRIPVLERDLLEAREMANILREQIEEACQGHEYLTEVVVAWTEETMFGPIWCRAMLDVLCIPRSLVLDPKALRIPAIAGAFGRTSSESGYDLQAGFYTRGVEAVVPELAGRLRFANLVVENFPPHGAAMFEPDAETKAAADFQIKFAIHKFAECLYARKWPAYPKTIQRYSTPAWRQQQLLAQTYGYETEEDDGERVQGDPSVSARSPAPDRALRPTGVRENLQRPDPGDGHQGAPRRPYRAGGHGTQSRVALRAADWRERQRHRPL